MRRIIFPGLSVISLVLLTALGYSPGAFGHDELEFEAELSGANEVPAVQTATTGDAKFEFKPEEGRIDFDLDVDDAVDILAVAGAHIHCAPEGQIGPVVVFLAGAVPGGFDGDVKIEASITQSNIVDPACGATLAGLVQSMIDGNTYVNVHSAAHPGGEIRGQIRLED